VCIYAMYRHMSSIDSSFCNCHTYHNREVIEIVVRISDENITVCMKDDVSASSWCEITKDQVQM